MVSSYKRGVAVRYKCKCGFIAENRLNAVKHQEIEISRLEAEIKQHTSLFQLEQEAQHE